MRHYHKNKYIKKLNLFSKDAVKSLDTSGARYDTFTWNNIRDLGLYGDCKMKIGSLDFDTNANADVDIQAPVPPIDLVVHYKFDGDFLDSSGYDYHILENEGGVSIDTADYKKGTGSVDFDATLTKGLWIDKISIKQSRISPHVYQNPNGMTISFWVKLTSAGLLGSVWERLFQAHKTTSSAGDDYCAIESTGGQKDISLIVAGNGVLSRFNKSITSLADKWFHLTWVMIPESTNWLAEEHTWKIYIDGVLTDTKINMYYPEWNDDWDFALGKWASGVVSGNEREMDGNLDDFRIYDRALSSDEINRIMAEIQKDPIVHYKFDGDFTNSGTQIVTTELINTPVISTDNFKRGTGSMFLENNTKGIEIPSNPLAGLKQITFSMWVHWTEVGAPTDAAPHLLFQSSGISIRPQTATTLRVYVTNGVTWGYYYEVPFVKADWVNKWFHFTCTIDYSLTNQVAKVFLNGVELSGTHNSTLNITGYPTLTSKFGIGVNNNLGNYTAGIIGYVDDFRIYDKTLDANEIREVMWENRGLYMWYKFEPVINNFVANDDLVVHYKFDGDVVENIQNTPTTIIGTEVYGVGKRFDNCAYFNASWACSIDAADNPLTTVTNAITICTWIKLDSLVREHIIRKDLCYSLRIGSNGSPGVRVVFNIANGVNWAGTDLISGPELTTNTWYHIAITYDFSNTAGSLKCYINGVLDTTPYRETYDNITTSLVDNAEPIYIGQEPDGNKFDGYIEDLRIYNKVLTEDEIQSLYSRYLTFQDGMYNTIMTDEHSGFDVSTVKKQGNYSLDLTGGNKGGSITLTDSDVNLFENLQRISFCAWVYLTGFNEFMYVFHQEPVLSVYLQYSTSRIHVLLGGGQLMYWQLTFEEIANNYFNKWKHVTVVIDFSETDPLQKVLLYIDGVSKGAGTMSGSTSLTAYPSTTNKFYVGSYDGTNNGFNGYIDDLRIYTFQVEPDDIALIMGDTETKYTSIYNIKCNEVYDTYESNSKTPTIYHNRGVLRNKHIINPYFKVNTPLNSLSLNITHFVDGAFEPRGLEPEDQFMITLLVQEDDKKETAEGNRMEYYHRNPQFRIKY